MARRRKDKDEVKLVPEEDATIPSGSKKARVNSFLDDYYKRHGQVDAEGVLAEATDPNCPIHNDLEWDNSIAAHNYRRQQVMNMILSWKLVATFREKRKAPPTAVAHRVKVRAVLPSGEKNVFLRREDIKADPLSRQNQVDRYLNRLRNWCDETIDFEELDGIRTMILQSVENWS